MHTDYREQLNAITGQFHFLPSADWQIPAEQRVDYLKFIAGMKYFNRSHASTVNIGNFLEFQGNNRLRNLEFENAYRLEAMGLLKVAGEEKIDSGRPAIYFSFHIGSYFACPLSLFARGVKLSLCFGPDSFEEQEKAIRDVVRKCKEVFPDGVLDTINVGSKTATMVMQERVAQGHSLFFFIDGNKGSTDFQSKDLQLLPVRLLDGELRSRRGIARLAYLLKLPLIPVFSYRTAPDDIRVEYLDSIVASEEKASFIDGATIQMWNCFASYFEKYPTQWASVAYCYQFRPQRQDNYIAPFSGDSNYVFNDQRYGFDEENEGIMYDYLRLEPIGVPGGYAALLKKIHMGNMKVPGRVLAEIVKNQAAINLLISKEVLISNRV
jgi:hypothetical protein